MNIFRLILPLVVFVFVCTTHVFGQEGQPAENSEKDTAASIFEAISQNGAYTESLASVSQNTLPIGLSRVVNNMEVTIAVDKAKFYADYAELNVFAKAVLPQNSNGREITLFFGGRGIKLSYDGSIIGDANLVLLGDVEIPFNDGMMSLVLLGDYNTTTGSSQSKTYMSIECSGFKELGLNAEVRFPTTLIERTSPEGANRTVSGHFQTVVKDWNDIIANVTLPAFQIVGLDGFAFNLRDVVLDFSDSKNSDAIRFPSGYEQKYMIPGSASLWRGVYAKNIEVTLPKPFNDKNDTPARIAANDMIIDDNGITGLFSAENVLSFDAGDASGWNFSVNKFMIGLEANKMTGGGFGGQIGLPIKGDTKLDYEAYITENNEYQLTVSPAEKIDFAIFSAKARINPNSQITLRVENDKFKPEALLHGAMSIEAGGFSVPELEFRSLCLRTEEPYISVGQLGCKDKISLGAFPVSLEKLTIGIPGNGRVELGSDVKVGLDDAFAGTSRLRFAASLKDVDGRKKWDFDNVSLDKVAINASIAEVVKLDGELEWRQGDPVYGDGFAGGLKVDITKPFDLNVSMYGCFGAVDGYRYWVADGSVELPSPGIPIGAGLNITGFSGAVSQKMIGTGQQPQDGNAFLKTVYVPDNSISFGVKASVLLTMSKAATGEASFDIAFTDRGGLAYIGFYGYAKFAGELPISTKKISEKYAAILEKEKALASDMTTLTKLKQVDPNKAAASVCPIPSDLHYGVVGSLGIKYDFQNKSFHANTEIYLNTPGGFLQGSSPGGLAGWGVLHFDPDEWYLHLGTPTNRMGAKLNLGNLLNVEIGTYLMAGSQIPEMPAPPQAVADILRMDLSSLTMGRSMDALSTGKGFAFGTDFSVRTGDITFLMMYANFLTGLGFDFMLKDYGEMQCAQTGKQVGMDGWFAQGQAYAYLQGELGVKVNLGFIKTKVPIIKGSAATLMQAMLPNPSSFKGYLAVNVNVLGLVKGNMRFQMSLGDQCDPISPGASPLQMDIISDIAPSDNTSDVSVFVMPQVTFTTSIGETFEAEDDAGKHTYKVQLKSFDVTDEQGNRIAGMLKWNSAKNAVSFQAKEILPPESKINAEVKVSFDRFEGGAWKTVYTSGKEAIESKECSFTTGGAPDCIPLQNILYSYPVIDQKYFLTEEYRKGFTQLQFGQKYLFESGFDYKLMFCDGSGRDITTDFKYNEQKNRIEYNIPELARERNYTLRLAYLPDASEGVTSGSPGQQSSQTIDAQDAGSLTVENRAASADINTASWKSILDYEFATSRYATFSDKMGSINTEGNSKAQDAGMAYRFLYEVQADEPFDEAEVVGVEKTDWQALIRPTAAMNEPFYEEIVKPLVYSGYPFGPVRLTARDEQLYGVPPVKSVLAYDPYLNVISNGTRPRTFFFPFSYETAIIVERDFRDLQSQVVNNKSNVSEEVYYRFVMGSLPFLKHGYYKTVMKYTLPDGTVTSHYNFNFYNHLLFNK